MRRDAGDRRAASRGPHLWGLLGGRSVRSLWRFAVVLFLVPVVVFSTPATASAAFAPQQGPWVGASWRFDGIGIAGVNIEDADCFGKFSMRSDALGQNILRAGAGYCVSGVDHSPWMCQLFEPDCTWYSIEFEGSPACENIVMEPATRNVAEDSFMHVHSGWVAAEALAGTCDPTQACLTVDDDSERTPNSGSTRIRVCDVVEIDPLIPEPGAGCPQGTVSVGFTNAGFQDITITVNSTASTVVDWGFRWLYATDGVTTGNPLPASGIAVVIAAQPNTATVAHQQNGLGGNVTLHGLEIYAKGWMTNGGAPGNDPRAGSQVGNYPPATHTNSDGIGFYGITDVSRCRFYFGASDIASGRAASLYSTPYAAPNGSPASAPVEDPPVTDPGDPDDSAPADEPSFWAALVSLLRSIYGAIVGLASKIVSGILSGLSGLFIPDDAVIDAEVSGLRSAWDDTSLGKWKDAVVGQSYSMPSAGCDGVPVDVDLPGGVGVHERFGAACSGAMANTAAIIKTVMSAGLIIFGGLACLRALGSGFGWNPGVGRGES